MKTKLLEVNHLGLYCKQGDFYIDPLRSVDRAVITHAHSDHARRGSHYYLTSKKGEIVLKHRLGKDINLETIDYNSSVSLNGVKVSLHPAGHIIGSSQVRIEYKGEVVVVSGDYKVTKDTTGNYFEPIKCDTFITESTFALPIYNWKDDDYNKEQLNKWWSDNSNKGVTSIILGYSLGKAQRIISLLDSNIGEIYCHSSVEQLNEAYRLSGIELTRTNLLNVNEKKDYSKALILLPPGSDDSKWMRGLSNYSKAFASGWMAVRGNKRRSNIDKGFVISDHADWKGLLWAIEETGAENIIVTHGFSEIFARYLNEKGKYATILPNYFSRSAVE
jgi:putative mRNA 3-end processing factor